MTGSRARAIATSLAIATLAVACTGSDQPEVQPPLESAEPLTSLPPTTEAPATTVADSTVAPESTTTTVADTTTTSTTTEPSPSTTTLEDLRAEIERDIDEGERAVVEALGDPGSERAIVVAMKHLGGGALERTLELFEEATRTGLRFRLRDDLPSFIRVLAEPTMTSATAAVVRTCRIDAAIGFLIEADGTEEVTADTIVRTIADTEVTFEDGTWKLLGGTRISRDEGETTCDG